MIKDFDYSNNDDIVIYDNVRGLKRRNMQDNIDEIFISENVIEQLQKELEQANDKKILLEIQLNNKCGIGKKLKTFFYSLICSLIIFSLFLAPYSPILIPIISILSSTIISLIVNKINYECSKDLRDNINGLTVLISEFEKLLTNEKEKLNELKNNKTNNNIKKNPEEFRIKNSNKITELKKLKQLYIICGEHIKLLNAYKENNIMKEKLSYQFDDEEINIIKNVVDEKGPTLLKRK